MKQKTAGAVLALSLLTGGGAALVAPGIAVAADSSSSATASSTATERASARLSALEDALKGLITGGTITQAQADKVAGTLASSDLDLGGHHGHGRLGPATTAQALGIPEQELHDARDAGKTLTQIAADKGISRADLVTKLVAAAKAELDADLATGRITQARHDQALSGLQARISERVDQARPARLSSAASSDSSATPSASSDATAGAALTATA